MYFPSLLLRLENSFCLAHNRRGTNGMQWFAVDRSGDKYVKFGRSKLELRMDDTRYDAHLTTVRSREQEQRAHTFNTISSHPYAYQFFIKPIWCPCVCVSNTQLFVYFSARDVVFYDARTHHRRRHRRVHNIYFYTHHTYYTSSLSLFSILYFLFSFCLFTILFQTKMK